MTPVIPLPTQNSDEPRSVAQFFPTVIFGQAVDGLLVEYVIQGGLFFGVECSCGGIYMQADTAASLLGAAGCERY